MGHAESYRCVTQLCPLSSKDGAWAPWLDLMKTADPTTTSSLANGDHMGFVQYKQRDGN